MYQPFIYHNLEVVRVIDGHTIRLKVDVGFRQTYEDNFRLAGIDTPERSQVGYAEATKALTIYTKRAFYIEVTERDKFGRYLCRIRDRETGDLINQLMIEGGYALPYDGGKKAERPLLANKLGSTPALRKGSAA